MTETPSVTDQEIPDRQVEHSETYIDLGDVVALDEATPATQPYDPEPDRERMRGRIAGWLIGSLVGLSFLLVFVSVVMVRPFDREAVALLISGIFGPIIGIVGTVVGFYFGQISGRSHQ